MSKPKPIIVALGDTEDAIEVIALHPDRLRFEEAELCSMTIAQGRVVAFDVYFRGEDYRTVDAVYRDYAEAGDYATPVVGMGATQVIGSDRYAYTVVDVLTPNKIVVQRDEARLVEGSMMSEVQGYDYTPCPDAPRITLRRTGGGRWVNHTEVAGYVRVGVRNAYRDPTM